MDAQEYLRWYRQQSLPRLQTFLEQKKVVATQAGAIPLEIFSQFANLVPRGKFFRGALATLSYQASGGKDVEAMIDASLAIELLETALLVHDDIMDRDTLRRGVATVHEHFRQNPATADAKHYGIAQAINCADAGFFLAYGRLSTADFDPRLLASAIQLFSRLATKVVYGQSLDVAGAHTEEEILSVYEYKTASYTGILPMLLGATLVGERDKKRLAAMEMYGRNLGLAFQIQDDLLSVFGDITKIGKAVGNDIREGKVTLLVAHLRQHGTAQQQTILTHVLGSSWASAADIQKLQEIFKTSGAYDYAKKLMTDALSKAQQCVEVFSNEATGETFQSFLQFVSTRQG